jgi:hypothetical protein
MTTNPAIKKALHQLSTLTTRSTSNSTKKKHPAFPPNKKEKKNCTKQSTTSKTKNTQKTVPGFWAVYSLTGSTLSLAYLKSPSSSNPCIPKTLNKKT